MSLNKNSRVGIGPTEDLSLRVSVAVLVRLLFRNPADGVWTLALERKANLYDDKERGSVEVKAQPFGGGVRILDINGLHGLIGDFHFDSERSRTEGDFRLFIQPERWQTLKAYCIEQFKRGDERVFDTDPGRELSEEICDTLNAQLSPSSYTSRATGIVIEDLPRATENPRARSYATVRLYKVFEAIITDPNLSGAIVQNAEDLSDKDLVKMAIADARKGGKGRANGIFAAPLEAMSAFYHNMSIEERDQPVVFEGHCLADSVLAILDDIPVPKYQRK